MRDVSVPWGSGVDCGVNARLVFALREALDNAWQGWNLPRTWQPIAQRWCREVRIVVTGGFKPEKIRQFEELGVPADIYGVGSYLLSSCDAHGTNNDYTADVVRVKIDGTWHDMAKAGRAPARTPPSNRCDLPLACRAPPGSASPGTRGAGEEPLASCRNAPTRRGMLAMLLLTSLAAGLALAESRRRSRLTGRRSTGGRPHARLALLAAARDPGGAADPATRRSAAPTAPRSTSFRASGSGA